MIEGGVRFDDLRLLEPVRSVHRISHDPTLKTIVELSDGRKITALDLQHAYLERAWQHEETTQDGEIDPMTREVLDIWSEVLDDLGTRPAALRRPPRLGGQAQPAGELPQRDSLPWDSPKLHLVDLQYSDVRHGQGSLQPPGRPRLDQAAGRRGGRSAPPSPRRPEDTRAYFRGRCLERYPTEVAAASWDSVIFDLGRESLVRIPTLEPLRGTSGARRRAHRQRRGRAARWWRR